ncbi:mitochondrial fission ELM1 family protein [Gammaproteobacteria bacterium]|nr:mitochondrial fission ELM1 family protein [Gammaproteobacteria bacterium]
MNILWISDGKKGHEKQVEILLNEISKTENINIQKEIIQLSKFSQLLELVIYSTCLLFGNVFLSKNKFLAYKKNQTEVVIGAGSSIHIRMLLIKSYLSINNTSIKAISILTPNLYKNHFDIICSPMHDIKKLPKNNKVIYFEGSLAKVSSSEVDESLGFIGIGGINKHYIFDQDSIMLQIEFLLGLYPQKKWFLFTTRRTPNEMIHRVNKVASENNNLIIAHDNYDAIIEKASIKVVTQDSVNMVYESLSTKGQTFLFNMKYIKVNKIVNQIGLLLKNKQVGYIENTKMVEDLNKIKIISQNLHHDVFAEVEKVAYKLILMLKSKNL